MVYVGIDWAEAHHDVCLLDEAGIRLGKARVPDGIEGSPGPRRCWLVTRVLLLTGEPGTGETVLAHPIRHPGGSRSEKRLGKPWYAIDPNRG
jgi:hypothetical protein